MSRAIVMSDQTGSGLREEVRGRYAEAARAVLVPGVADTIDVLHA